MGRDIAGRNSAVQKVPRRWFCKAAASGLGGLALAQYLPQARAGSLPRRPLIPPRATGKSVALCLNSRASEHDGPLFTATAQQFSNVLWAAGRAPITGSHRTIYVTTAQGTFIYHPSDHSLEDYSTDTTNQAFRITYDRERDFDAGVSYMTATLASVSLWNGTTNQLASCPQGAVLNFGIRDVGGHTEQLVALSSDSSLPRPVTTGRDKLERVLETIDLQRTFRPQWQLTQEELTQILWAAYGPTPHSVYLGRAGVTSPSAFADYYLTRKIYVVKERVLRYTSRVGTDLYSHDHRVEQVLNADVRTHLRRAVPSLPEAPCYLLLCLSGAGLGVWFQKLEAGFVAGNVLMQGAALGVGCDFALELSPDEHADIQQATHIPTTDFPYAVVAVGKPYRR